MKELVPFESVTRLVSKDSFNLEVKRYSYNSSILSFTYHPNEYVDMIVNVVPASKMKYGNPAYEAYPYWTSIDNRCVRCIARKVYNLASSFAISYLVKKYCKIDYTLQSTSSFSTNYFNNLISILGGVGLNSGNYSLCSYNKKCLQFCDSELKMDASSPCNLFYPFNSIFPHLPNSNIPWRRTVNIEMSSQNGFYDDIFTRGNCNYIKNIIDPFDEKKLRLSLDSSVIWEIFQGFNHYNFKVGAELCGGHSLTLSTDTYSGISVLDLFNTSFNSDFKKLYPRRNKTRMTSQFSRCNNCGNIHLITGHNQIKLVSIRNMMFEDKFDEFDIISNGGINIVTEKIDAHDLFFQL